MAVLTKERHISAKVRRGVKRQIDCYGVHKRMLVRHMQGANNRSRPVLFNKECYCPSWIKGQVCGIVKVIEGALYSRDTLTFLYLREQCLSHSFITVMYFIFHSRKHFICQHLLLNHYTLTSLFVGIHFQNRPNKIFC